MRQVVGRNRAIEPGGECGKQVLSKRTLAQELVELKLSVRARTFRLPDFEVGGQAALRAPAHDLERVLARAECGAGRRDLGVE